MTLTTIGIRREDYRTHSLRGSEASIIGKATGNLRAMQSLLGRAKIGWTVRNLASTSKTRSLLQGAQRYVGGMLAVGLRALPFRPLPTQVGCE